MKITSYAELSTTATKERGPSGSVLGEVETPLEPSRDEDDTTDGRGVARPEPRRKDVAR